jgi:Fic family protein
MRKGQKHTQAAKDGIGRGNWEAKRRTPEDDARRIEGQTTAKEFAVKEGVTLHTARNRLNRILDAGLAERFAPRGMRGFIYVAIVRPGDITVKRRRQK